MEDNELDALLRQWETPQPPSANLRARVFARQPLWRRFWTMSIRIPLPVAVAALLAGFGLGAWRLQKPPEPHKGPSKLQPVTELRPRIIRSQHVQN